MDMPSDLVKKTGSLLLGYVFNFVLYGTLCVQVYLYYISFPNDHVRSKAVVYGVFFIETAQVLMNVSDVFDLFAAGYGKPETLDQIHLSWLAVPILTGVGNFIVQTFYGHRIYLLTDRKLVPIFIVLLALTQFASALVGGVQVFLKGRFSDIESTRTASTIWLAGSAACDLVIAIAMTKHLIQADTGFRSTHIMLTKIIRLVIETGTVTASVAVIDLALFLGFPHETYHTVPAQTLAKLYSNAILVLFNSRVKVRGGREDLVDSDDTDIELARSGIASGLSVKFNHAVTTTQQDRLSIHDEPWTDQPSLTSRTQDPNNTLTVKDHDDWKKNRSILDDAS